MTGPSGGSAHPVRTDRRRVVGWLVAGAALLTPPALLAALRLFPTFDLMFESVDAHLIVVGVISLFAVGVATAAARTAVRTGQGALVVLAVGCIVVAGFMLAHGLTTPGTLGQPPNLWVGRLPVLALFGFAVCLALGATRPTGRLLLTAGRAPRALIGVVAALVVTVGAATVIWPDARIWANPMPFELVGRQLALVTAFVLLLVAGAVHWRRWRLSTDRVQLAVVVAAWQSAGAALSLELGQLWHLTWWDYHLFLFVGFGAAAYAVLRGGWLGNRSGGALGSVFVVDPLEHIERGYSDALQVLVGAVEARDDHTHGHSARVAEWAVRIGQELRLRPGQLKALAEGAYLHDVGKIGVPDHILTKPGPLTDDEWAWIKQHPVVGVEIAGRAPSLGSSLDMIRYHHERYDGTGYPDRLTGDQIPLLARVVAVADVWDALTSHRAYRTAWQPQEALDHMYAGRGGHFDPDCLDAFFELVALRGLRPRRPGNEHVADAAAVACHHPALAG